MLPYIGIWKYFVTCINQASLDYRATGLSVLRYPGTEGASKCDGLYRAAPTLTAVIRARSVHSNAHDIQKRRPR
jgi:hypothetical protein